MTTTIAATITITSCASSILILVLMMPGTASGGNLKDKIYRVFFIALILSAIGAFFEGISTVFIVMPEVKLSALLPITDFFSYIFGSVLAFFFFLYVYEYLSLKKAVRKAPFIFMILCICVNIILVSAGFITGQYSLLDANNNYSPHILTTIANLTLSIAMLVLIVVTLCNIKFLKRREWIPLLLYSVVPILCYVIEDIFTEYPLWITYFGGTLVLLLVYINLQVELKYTLLEKESELTQSRVAIMLTQIQPHFIHNSLLAIQDLCGRDGKEAEKAVAEFSKYLRGNLNSLTNNNTIYIEKELEHLRLYLSLEQRRFEERLQVEFDLQAGGFLLPALTLQPIVENAVLHGVTQRVEGGKVAIRSREDSTHWHITVEDTGVGFDPAHPKEDERSHIGIQNVQYRLKVMSNGTLDIQSTLDIGTTATISIPKGGNHI